MADARQLIDFARRQTQVNQLRYGEPIGVETLTKEVTDHIQQYTQVGGARPFGVALIVGGIDNGEPRLFETDPSGTPYEWKALAVGADRGDLQEYLEENYDNEADLDGGIASHSTHSRRSTTALCSQMRLASRRLTSKPSSSSSSTTRQSRPTSTRTTSSAAKTRRKTKTKTTSNAP